MHKQAHGYRHGLNKITPVRPPVELVQLTGLTESYPQEPMCQGTGRDFPTPIQVSSESSPSSPRVASHRTPFEPAYESGPPHTDQLRCSRFQLTLSPESASTMAMPKSHCCTPHLESFSYITYCKLFFKRSNAVENLRHTDTCKKCYIYHKIFSRAFLRL